MNSLLKYEFERLRKHCAFLTSEQFDAVAQDLVDTTAGYIDFSDERGCAVYYYESAAADISKKYGFTDDDQLGDVEMLAFEYSMFMSEEGAYV